MKIITLTKKNHKEVIKEAVKILKSGGSIVYPTDTAYGLGCDATSLRALKNVYKIKDRDIRKKPMHILIPSLSWAKKNLKWNVASQKISKAFLPGPLSFSLPLKSSAASLKLISSEGYLGIRYPNTRFALSLVKALGRPITATSANPSSLTAGGFTPYSAEDVKKQFISRKVKPDLIIDAGKLKKIKPSTFIKIEDQKIILVRKGPVPFRTIIDSLTKN